jgi:hypothetical protein
LVRYSNIFTDVTWTKSGLVTPNTIAAPAGLSGFGSSLNCTVTGLAGGRDIRQFVNLSAGVTYTLSAYMKLGVQPDVAIFTSNFNNTFLRFDLSTGAITGNSLAINPQMLDVGSGWYRVSYSFIATTTVASQIGLALQGFDVDSNPSWFFYVYGVQLEEGSAVTAYTDRGSAVPFLTPLTANPTSNGLLIEESRTNRILWNRDATQANWVSTNITAAKDQTGIDGVANAASSLTATSADGTCIQTITLASGSRTGSVYLKRITGTGTVQVSLDGSTWSTVDLSASEWRRIVLSGTVTNPTVGIKIATSGDAVAMDYAQVEDGAFVTTPILTTAATVVRSADVASMTGQNFVGWYQNGIGTVFTESQLPINTPVGATIYTIDAQDNANYMFVWRNSGTTYRVDITGLTVALLTLPLDSSITSPKTAVRVQNGNSGFAVNNLDAGVFRPVIRPTWNRLRIGAAFNDTALMNACIKRISYVPKGASDAGLKVLTGAT